MSHVTVIEDEATVRDVVKFHLERAGLEVVAYGSVTEAEAAGSFEVTDLLVLYWMLPGESGLGLLQRLRASSERRRLPVLMLTARAAEAERVEGLETGADDYLTKPFGAAELVARVRSHHHKFEISRLHAGGKGEKHQLFWLRSDSFSKTARPGSSPCPTVSCDTGLHEKGFPEMLNKAELSKQKGVHAAHPTLGRDQGC